MKFLITILSLFSLNAFAVQVKDCPTSLTVEYKNPLATKSLKNVLKDVDQTEESIAATTTAYFNFIRTPRVQREIEISQQKSGVCTYAVPESEEEKIVIYSTSGVDKLYIQTPIGPRGILARVYVKVHSLKNGVIEVDSSTASAALAVPRYPYTNYQSGGPLVFIGKVTQFLVK